MYGTGGNEDTSRAEGSAVVSKAEKWFDAQYRTIDPIARNTAIAGYNASAAEKAAELATLMACKHAKVNWHEGYPGKSYCTVCAELSAVTKERDALRIEVAELNKTIHRFLHIKSRDEILAASRGETECTHTHLFRGYCPKCTANRKETTNAAKEAETER